jgi:ubiquinone/menaquinone biosynthesis C-methylase UbiE
MPALAAAHGRLTREYERLCEKPERQADLASLKTWLQEETAGQDVLEIACGTGYWTQVCATRARSVLAVDVAEETLAMARAREYPFGKVRFGQADVYQLEDVPGQFTAGLASFWWSRIPPERQAGFLEAWHRRLGSGARALFMDHRHAEGSGTSSADAIRAMAVDAKFTELDYYWTLSYTLPQ